MFLSFFSVSITINSVYDYNSPYGESCYRLITRSGDFIYMRTRGYLDIERDTNQVKSFVCVNALVEEEEGKKLVKEMKKKFTIMIQETEISSNEPDVPAVENPVQLERAIISLITNLHHEPGSSSSRMIESPEAQGSPDGHESDTNRSVKSPPLEIIPPKASSIKTSIVNSLEMVNFRHAQRSSAKSAGSDSDDDDKTMVKKTTKVVRTSVVQRNANAKLCDDTSNRSKSSLSSPPPKSVPSSTITVATASTTTTNHSQSNTQPNCTTTSGQSATRDTNDSVTVKQEQPDYMENSRVPPLPTNAGYFEMSPYNTQQYIEDMASPLECKPFDFLGFDPLQVQQADQNRYLTPETAAQFQQYDTGDINNRTISTINDTSSNNPSTTNVSGIKRSCSSENVNQINNKRRFYDVSQCSTKNSSGDDNENDDKISLSIHQTCIDHLTDPRLGIFLLLLFFKL